MSTLYELTGIYQDIYQMDIDDETKADTLEAMDWNEDFINKVEGYVKVIKNLDGDEATVDAEIKRLQDRKKTIQNKKKKLKDNLQTAMELTGNEKVKTALFSVSVSNTKASVIVEEDRLPKKYMVITTKPDKKTLYDLLKEGKKIRGAVLQPNRSLRIS